ncbi:hypothetical protein ACIRLA_36485 [Streptomyces sp. NPDC102364]|uniref:hypothetical protein n=1 Tax=Streptomyces sp. NPDC102364 TaxID=3366161 RepID=UPI003828A053
MAGRSGQYYRAGHWVSRSRSTGKSKAAKKSTAVVVVGLLAVLAWMGFANDSDAQGPKQQPSPTATAGR